MGNFDFIKADWPGIATEAARAEFYTFCVLRSSLFHARRTVELAVYWLYRADASLQKPYENDLASLLHEPTFKRLVGPAVFTKMNLIRKRGNDAVHKTFKLSGHEGAPNGVGRVDYVLWGDDGLPLGIVEAKRTKRDARNGQHQAKLYADALERKYGQRPVIFTSNGYEHTETDLEELKRMLTESGECGVEELAPAIESAHGLGRFIRSNIWLVRSVAQEALASLVTQNRLGSPQISFVDLIVNRLAQTGSVPIGALYGDRRNMAIGALYGRPFSEKAPGGPEDLFTEAEIVDLEAVLNAVDATAEPADAARTA
ncbi:DUF4145 domain-containing protein [Agromyces bauzanensis]|uniref:Uncharacterized protein n=1 Tax=Agromyces bauzanensis TaxID=1308924 RepID=A0A917PGU0_9MICO|nr:DUF4145 domain-containing protein [Agromyces bauzanensis]GGJ77981.1 hypothetical protein GCM10011372_15380 [Agromyces bauzanensis]